MLMCWQKDAQSNNWVTLTIVVCVQQRCSAPSKDVLSSLQLWHNPRKDGRVHQAAAVCHFAGAHVHGVDDSGKLVLVAPCVLAQAGICAVFLAGGARSSHVVSYTKRHLDHVTSSSALDSNAARVSHAMPVCDVGKHHGKSTQDIAQTRSVETNDHMLRQARTPADWSGVGRLRRACSP